MEKETLYIIIPAYNEQDTIAKIVTDWYPILDTYGNEDSKMVILDDGSKDNTYKILKQLEHDYPKLVPVHKSNSGHGATIRFGYQIALDCHADYIFQTDSDGQTLPSEFKDFWQKRNAYDMLVGWRKHRQDGFSRKLVTKTLKAAIKCCFHVTIPDANTPYRLINCHTLKTCMDFIPENYNLTNVLLSVICEKKQYKNTYLPITFLPRQGGVNSINLRKIFKIGIQAVKDFRNLNQIIS